MSSAKYIAILKDFVSRLNEDQFTAVLTALDVPMFEVSVRGDEQASPAEVAERVKQEKWDYVFIGPKWHIRP